MADITDAEIVDRMRVANEHARKIVELVQSVQRELPLCSPFLFRLADVATYAEDIARALLFRLADIATYAEDIARETNLSRPR